MAQRTYVLTGGPGTGKTTLCDALSKNGFAVVPEAARAIIAEEQAKEHGILPWTDLPGFQELVYRRQLEGERQTLGAIRFCDRGLVDNLGYCAAGNIAPPQTLEELVKHVRYTGVFVLEPLGQYEVDGERKEDAAESVRLHEHITAAYRNNRYTPVLVPAFPYLSQQMAVRKRVNYILSMIGGTPWEDATVQVTDSEKHNESRNGKPMSQVA